MVAHTPYLPHTSRLFTDAVEALAFTTELYRANVAYLQEAFDLFLRGETPPHKVEAHYPYVSIETEHGCDIDTRLSYGFVAEPSRYSTTLTQPDIFVRYYLEQFEQLLKNHKQPLEIGVSTRAIPIHFAFQNGQYVEGGMSPDRVRMLHELFTVPDLADVDDAIANGTFIPASGQDRPLSLFTAPRVDYSLQRLRHYTGTNPEDFQSFVIFTNYQFYVDEFVRQGQDLIDEERRKGDRAYTEMVVPEAVNGSSGHASFAQMPAYHLKRADRRGITMINIGVGPSNARNISDHVAVLRPDAWIMLGHCAGLRNTQKLGDYVLAHAYVRDDHSLDQEVPLWVPIPALAEVQSAMERAVEYVTGHSGYGRKSVMRTGTVVSTDNRNWEISGYANLVERFSQSRAIAMDMESAVIAANGYRFRVPYGTLLCVSDRPMHGEIKLPGMATRFYEQQVNQHLEIGIHAVNLLRDASADTLHSRKLRSFKETAFR
ncbi:MAG: AMP nucleosidase [Bdellovibrionales bacterium]